MEQQRARRHLGEAKWRELLREFDEGSDTVEVFCKRQGVPKSSFQRWRSRMDGSATPRSSSATGGRIPKPKPKPKPKPLQAGFVDLGSLSLPSSGADRLELTLDLGGGVTLRVARG